MNPKEISEKPTLGLALAGSGLRLAFYIGFLEEIQKAGIKLDYIAASSSGAIVAASFACGTMEILKQLIFSLKNKDDLKKLVTKSRKGGLYSMDKLEKICYTTLTKGLNFEQVKPLMGFVAVDIDNGKQVVMSMGDIAHAARVSSTIPGFFKPIKWGGRTMIDGGLLNVIPVDVVRQAGIDVVIGVNTRSTNHIFLEWQLILKRFFNLTKKSLFIDQLEKAWDYVSSNIYEKKEKDEESPGVFTVLGKSLDLAIKASKEDHSKFWDCDLMISPDLSKYGIKNFAASNKELYEIGKSTAKIYIPKIKYVLEMKQKCIR